MSIFRQSQRRDMAGSANVVEKKEVAPARVRCLDRHLTFDF